MKKSTTKKPDLLPEYDFSKGVRGKYAERYAKGTNVVVIDRDLTRKFPTAQAVNDALRKLLKASPANKRT